MTRKREPPKVAISATELTPQLWTLLRALQQSGTVTCREASLLAGKNMNATQPRLQYLSRCGLVAMYYSGVGGFAYRLTSKGRDWCEPSAVAPARTSRFEGQQRPYCAESWPHARAQQNDFLTIPSLGLAT